MAIGGMCFFLIMTIDIMFIKKYHGSESVAFYSTAIKLMNIITMVILSINIGVSGEIAEHFENNNRIALQMLLKRSARLIFFISLPIVLLMCFFSNSILSIFGGQYKIASGALIVMMIGQGISAAFGAAPVYLNMTGRQKSFQFILIITVFLDLFLNFMLTPVYGILGTSIAFTISSLFWIITASIIIYKKDKINVFIV
jgi:O-antigen/teichoic acid export membrane protein